MQLISLFTCRFRMPQFQLEAVIISILCIHVSFQNAAVPTRSSHLLYNMQLISSFTCHFRMPQFQLEAVITSIICKQNISSFTSHFIMPQFRLEVVITSIIYNLLVHSLVVLECCSSNQKQSSPLYYASYQFIHQSFYNAAVPTRSSHHLYNMQLISSFTCRFRMPQFQLEAVITSTICNLLVHSLVFLQCRSSNQKQSSTLQYAICILLVHSQVIL